MTCKQFIDLLNDYVEDVLPAERREVLDRHLEICPDCVAFLQSYRATMEMSAKAMRSALSRVAEDMPESLVDAILTAEAERREPPDDNN